jgi:hypothetical protein
VRHALLTIALIASAPAFAQQPAARSAPAPKPAAAAAAAEPDRTDRADIERSQIIGNRELPKVIYIVPWKKPLPGQLSGKPVNSVLDEALAPVDREVFRRQVSYSGQVQAQLSAKAEKAPEKAADNKTAPSSNNQATKPAAPGVTR